MTEQSDHLAPRDSGEPESKERKTATAQAVAQLIRGGGSIPPRVVAAANAARAERLEATEITNREDQ